KVKEVMNTVISRYDAGVSNYKSTGGMVIEPKIDIREATKKGFAEAHESDSVNYQFPDSETRRGRVGKQVANTLEASGVNQGVVIKNEEIDVVGNIYKSQGQAGKVYTTNGVSPTVQRQRTNSQGWIVEDLRIRKLTPLECWRLQGFTDEQFYKAKNDGVSDSQLY